MAALLSDTPPQIAGNEANDVLVADFSPFTRAAIIAGAAGVTAVAWQHRRLKDQLMRQSLRLVACLDALEDGPAADRRDNPYRLTLEGQRLAPISL